ncbi:MAG: hypothetical protein JW800_00090 [Candidatus Omnitrophica bacterium]|nr:hypothetical protein [Candidatus Omnitrophota bacterium]
MSEDELIIGSVRAQANRLKEVLSHMEIDQKWKDHSSYYAKEMHDIERNLRKIRKGDFEPINMIKR